MVDKNKIKDLHLDGCSQEEIAGKFGISRKSVRIVLNEYGLVSAPNGRKKATEKVVVVGDVHLPEQDEPSLSAVLEFCKTYKPTMLIWNGDIVNFDSLSHFNKNKPLELENVRVKDDIDALINLKKRFETVIPKSCKKIYNLGNHEHRVYSYVQENPVWEGMLDFQKIMGKDWEVNPYNYLRPVGKLLVTHGIYHNLFFCRKHLDMIGKSVLISHLHRQQQFSKSVYGGDITAVSTGCLSNLNPKYLRNKPSAFSLGFATVELDDEGNFFINNIKIVNGKFSYGGEIYGC